MKGLRAIRKFDDVSSTVDLSIAITKPRKKKQIGGKKNKQTDTLQEIYMEVDKVCVCNI